MQCGGRERKGGGGGEDSAAALEAQAKTHATAMGDMDNTDNENCALTHLDGVTYLAVSENLTADNVSVWKSSDLATWTQIGSDFTLVSDAAGVAIATTGTTASDNGVWVAVNDAGNIKVLHYEDIAGGSSYAWRNVGNIISGSTVSGAAAGISIATDASNVIGVSAIVSGEATVGFWYNE